MATRKSPETVLSEAAQIANVWASNPDFALGSIKLADFQAAVSGLQTADATVETKRTELTGLMNQRDAKTAALHDLVTRARSGFRAVYGPDSTQYDQAGGTRLSERKRPLRPQKAEPIAA